MGCLSAHGEGQLLSAPEIYRQSLPSIVTLDVTTASGASYVGTAFLAVEDGWAVTACHLVHDAESITARFSDGETVPVNSIIAKDEVHDIALLKLPPSNRPLLTLRQSPPEIGSKVYVIGSPRGYEFSFADGLVSQIRQIDGITQFQVSCPFSTGNSGGPIITGEGDVLGVCSWSKMNAQNLNFCIPAHYAANMANNLNNKQLTAAQEKHPPIPTLENPESEKIPLRTSSSQTSAFGTLKDFQEYIQTVRGKEVFVEVVTQSETNQFRFTLPDEKR